MASRYTPIVGWNQRTISIVVLTVLTLLPASGTLCALACDSTAPAAASSHHHGSGQGCDEAPRLSSGVQIRGIAEHDCGNHEAVVGQAATAAAERAQFASPSAPPAVSAASDTFRALPISRGFLQDGAPPGTAPPTTTPLVLRV